MKVHLFDTLLFPGLNSLLLDLRSRIQIAAIFRVYDGIKLEQKGTENQLIRTTVSSTLILYYIKYKFRVSL